MNQIYYLIAYVFHYDYAAVILILKIVGGALSLLFLAGIAYSVIRTQEVFRIYRGGVEFTKKPALREPHPKNVETWENIMRQGGSTDENQRKLAIIAADSLLDKIFELAAFPGSNLGERLSNMDKSELGSLQDAWEAHKVRNRIAHEADAKLSQEEALRALRQFQKVLAELKYL